MSKTKKNSPKNACCVHDITIFDNVTPEYLRDIFDDIGKRFAFQKEIGEKTKKEHYQCRISLKTKARDPELAKKLRARGLNNFNVSTTSTVNKDNDFYVMKEETRVSGPFTDKNFKYIPIDVRNMTELRPWQKSLRRRLLKYNERRVDVLIDNIGNKGKTRWTRWMECYEDADTIDFANDYKDVMRMAYDLGPKKVYMIDMPRAISKDKLFQFFGAIETLKSGKCFDDRYEYKKRLFDPPRIVLFCNKKPDTTLLSGDMWKLWMINDNQKLVPYEDIEEEYNFVDDGL